MLDINRIIILLILLLFQHLYLKEELYIVRYPFFNFFRLKVTV
jgi:hypothetical protein